MKLFDDQFMDINFISKWVSFSFFSISAILHFYFFYIESFLYQKSDGYKYFKVAPQDHKATRVWAFNQGIYNFFLALQMSVGLVFVRLGEQKAAGLLVGLSGLTMIGAGIALYFSAKHLRKAALIQMIPPALGFLFLSMHAIR